MLAASLSLCRRGASGPPLRPSLRPHNYPLNVALPRARSLFIGASFIIKKKGLLMSVEKGGSSASAGGFSYLRQPVWWLGMLTMIGGESANFIAYAYAPAILVTPLGAATIAASAVFARFFLGEDMHICGARRAPPERVCVSPSEPEGGGKSVARAPRGLLHECRAGPCRLS